MFGSAFIMLGLPTPEDQFQFMSLIGKILVRLDPPQVASARYPVQKLICTLFNAIGFFRGLKGVRPCPSDFQSLRLLSVVKTHCANARPFGTAEMVCKTG